MQHEHLSDINPREATPSARSREEALREGRRVRWLVGAIEVWHSRKSVTVSYSSCSIQGCKSCFPLENDNRHMFESKMIDVFEWENLPTQEACEMAQHLNEGTPMNIGEKLKLMCGRQTPRARTLKFLFNLPAFQSSLFQSREKARKILAMFLRNLILPDTSFASNLTVNWDPLENFYRSDDAVDPRTIDKAEEIITKTSSMLQSFEKTQRRLLVCLIGLKDPNCDVQQALLSSDTESSVEQLLLKYRVT